VKLHVGKCYEKSSANFIFLLNAAILIAISQEELLALLLTFSGTRSLTVIVNISLFLCKSSFLSSGNFLRLFNFKTYILLLFLLTYSFWPHYGPGVDSVSKRNEYQEYFLGVKAAVA
jgi:hypothetical protein